MASDEQLEIAVLARLHKDPRRSLSSRDVLEDVVESVDGATEDEIEYIASRLDDRGYINYPGGHNSTISLTPRGLQRYEEVSGETVIGGGAEDKLLQFLYDHERDNPRDSVVDREEVIDELDLDAEDVDTLVWYLEASGLVETTSGIGAEFFAVEITERGRQRTE